MSVPTDPVKRFHSSDVEMEHGLQREYEKLKRATQEWVASVEFNAFITLTFVPSAKVSYNRASKIFGRFLHQLKIRLFGRNSKKRLPLVPVVEKFNAAHLYDSSDENIHLHVLARFPGDPKDYMDLVASVWRAASRATGDPKVYCPDGNEWFLTPNRETFSEDMSGYLAKTCVINTEAVLWKYVSLEEAT